MDRTAEDGGGLAETELDALKLIFRNVHAADDGTFKIDFAGRSYVVDLGSMRIDNAVHEYVDVYDYVLKDCIGQEEAPMQAASAHAEVEGLVHDVVKITEEQFLEWLKAQHTTEEQSDAPSGRQLWAMRRGEDIAELPWVRWV